MGQYPGMSEQQRTSQSNDHSRAAGNHASQHGVSLPAMQPAVENGVVVQQQSATSSAPAAPPSSNNTGNGGLPPALKSNMEQLSGFSMDDVSVHYNSDKPAQLKAYAFAQGNQIHVAPGQERHLPHEAWHVVQQKQQRVQPTMQLASKLVNNDPVLEAEADTMGAKAMQMKPASTFSAGRAGAFGTGIVQMYSGTAVIQANGLVTAMITGAETGDMSTDMIVKIVRSQIGVPSTEAIVRAALLAFDVKVAKPAVDGWISWVMSSLPTAYISTIVAWATPAYNGLVAMHKVFKMLPEPVQNMIIFAMGRGMRAFLGAMDRVLSAENAEWMIDNIFVSDPSKALDQLIDWMRGLTTRPASFLYEKVKAYYGSEIPENHTEESPSEEKDDLPAESESTPEVQSKIDTLVSIDSSILKLNLGKPKVQKGKKENETSGSKPGGLAVPFNFSVHLFGKDLEANDTNEVILPWNGGIFLNVPKAELKVGMKLAEVFEVGSVVLTNLRLTDQGLESMGLAVQNLKIANDTVRFGSVGGSWDKEKGTTLEAEDGMIKAMGHEFPLAILLNLDQAGKFEKAGLSISALGGFEIIKDVFVLEKPSFTGAVARSGEVNMAFSGTPKLNIGGVLLDATDLTVAYDRTASGDNSFEVSADTLNLRYGKLALQVQKPRFQSATKQLHAEQSSLSYKKSNEPASEEAGWLSQRGEQGAFNWLDMLNVAPEASFTVPYVDLMGSSPYIKMGKPEVADISLSMLGVEARLDFLKKQGSLKGEFSKETSVPLISLPVPLLPGLEAYLDINVGADIKAILAAEMNKPDPEKAPWHVGGSATVDAGVWAKLSAGLQAGSQLVVAIAAGLYAKGEGRFNGMLGLSGGIQFMNTSIESVPGDPFKLSYKIAPSLIASAGIEVKAKALHVFQKTLYQREFKRWDMGKYKLEGTLTWNGNSWVADTPEGEFEGNRLNEPDYVDKPIEESRDVLLSAQTAIVNGGELRKELAMEIINKYKQKDQQVYDELDSYYHELAHAKSDRHDLRSQFLGRLRHHSDIKTLEKRIAELEKIVDTLKNSYREVLLVLVNVERVVQAIANNELDLGAKDLNSQLETIYQQDAQMEDARKMKEQVKQELRGK